MAKTPFFLSMFSQSPITPMQNHMAKCNECAERLETYFESVLNSDWESAAAIFDEISELENAADKLKREIRLNLPRTTFLPVSRDDLLELLRVQDDVANKVKDISGLILGRQMTFPEELHEQLRQLLTETIRATNLANKAAEGLNNLVRTGFNDQFVALVEELLLQLHDAEHQTDVSQVTLRKSLFALENSLKPVDVMFTYKIIELIGDVADSAQTSGNRMMSLIAN